MQIYKQKWMPSLVCRVLHASQLDWWYVNHITAMQHLLCLHQQILLDVCLCRSSSSCAQYTCYVNLHDVCMDILLLPNQAGGTCACDQTHLSICVCLRLRVAYCMSALPGDLAMLFVHALTVLASGSMLHSQLRCLCQASSPRYII